MVFEIGIGSPMLVPAGGEQYRLAAHIETCNVMGVDGEALPVRLADHNAVQRGERGQLQAGQVDPFRVAMRSEEPTSELQSLMRISYAVFCLQKKKQPHK